MALKMTEERATELAVRLVTMRSEVDEIRKEINAALYALQRASSVTLSNDELRAIRRSVGNKSWAYHPNGAKWIGIPIARALGLNLLERRSVRKARYVIRELQRMNLLRTFREGNAMRCQYVV